MAHRVHHAQKALLNQIVAIQSRQVIAIGHGPQTGQQPGHQHRKGTVFRFGGGHGQRLIGHSFPVFLHTHILQMPADTTAGTLSILPQFCGFVKHLLVGFDKKEG